MTEIYFTKNGSVEYCSDYAEQGCIDHRDTCSSTNGVRLACNMGAWLENWSEDSVLSSYNSSIGELKKHLYTTIDAPDEYMCDYNMIYPAITSEGMTLCGSDRIVLTRIAGCKTSACVSNASYDYGANKNGIDKANRCCKAPSDFQCESGECDYEYSIVTEEYSVDYELYKPASKCITLDRVPNGDFVCFGFGLVNHPLIVTDTCFIEQQSCKLSSPFRCNDANNKSCKEDTAPAGYTLVDSKDIITWSYEQKDCNCTTCINCISCDQLDCTLGPVFNNTIAGESLYYFGLVPEAWRLGGTDCCGFRLAGFKATNAPSEFFSSILPPPLCPIYGDGSENPWYCYNDSCIQVDDTSQDFDRSLYESGPYGSHRDCTSQCSDELVCMPPDKNYTRGECCNKNFQKEMYDSEKPIITIIGGTGPGLGGGTGSGGSAFGNTGNGQTISVKDSCRTIGPRYTKEYSYILPGCDEKIVTDKKEMCTIDNSKVCENERIVITNSAKTYAYKRPNLDKRYNVLCSSCNPAENLDCLPCPKNTQAILLKNEYTFFPEEVIDSKTIKIKLVYCQITVKSCA
jgi:hypothetical protein